MEKKELGNQNNDELLEELKGKYKSNVKRDIYCNAIILGLVILLLTFTWLWLGEPKDFSYFMFWIVFICFLGWLLLYDFRLLKKVDSFDSPDWLLYSFGKKHRYNLIGWIVACIFSILHLLYFI